MIWKKDSVLQTALLECMSSESPLTQHALILTDLTTDKADKNSFRC